MKKEQNKPAAAKTTSMRSMRRRILAEVMAAALTVTCMMPSGITVRADQQQKNLAVNTTTTSSEETTEQKINKALSSGSGISETAAVSGSASAVTVGSDILNKDTWTACTDGKFRKLVDVQGFNFTDGAYDIGTAKTEDHFYCDKAGLLTDTIVTAGVLEMKHSGAAVNLLYTVPAAYLNSSASYEFYADYEWTASNANRGLDIQVQQNGSDIKKITGTPGTAGTVQVTTDSFQVKTGTPFGLKLWVAAPISSIKIKKLCLIQVSDTNPDAMSDMETKRREHDILLPKNSGTFESIASIPAVWDASHMIFADAGAVSIVDNAADEDNSYRGNKAVQINAGKELKVDCQNLLPNTEYTMFFSAKPEKNATLEFRMSGFKNKDKISYDNGNHNGAWPDSERENLFNWVENLKISDSKEWHFFRYDFTTGDQVSSRVYASFTAKSGAVKVDDLFLVKKTDLQETTYQLPGNEELSRGHRALIDQGYQFMSWFPADGKNQAAWQKTPSLEAIRDMGITAIQCNENPNFNNKLQEQADQMGFEMKWATADGPRSGHISPNYMDGSDGRTGLPSEQELLNGYLTEEMGLNHINNAVSMCMGDEEDYSDTLTQNLKSWFELVREHYDEADGRQTPIILHHNEVGNSPQQNMKQISTFNKDMLRKYVRTAKPDLISFDMYYFRERRVEQTVGGTVMAFYDDLNRYNLISREGLDGTGEQPIPWGLYMYSWRTGPGAATALKRGDGWYEMTQSQINLYAFGPMTFGAKWLSNFRWLDENASYLFSDYKVNPDGTFDQYYIYDVFKEMIRQGKNLGPHLVRIQNRDIAVVSGEHRNKNTNAAVANEIPSDNHAWEADSDHNQKVFISGISAENPGEQNDGLNGDVFISYFEPLKGLTDADKEVFTCTDPRYFMILNGLTAGDGLPAEMQQGSAYETQQKITITFDNVPAGARLMKVSRVQSNAPEGAVVEVPLTNNTLVTTIGGGFADLYFWELGSKKSTTTEEIRADQEKTELIVGEEKYANPIESKDLAGRTIIVGNIKGTDDMAPEPSMASNINTPAADDLFDGNTIKLSSYATPGGNIGAIGTRYFKQDIWEFRLKRIEEDNNVKLEFKEYDWDLDTLLLNIQKKKNGERAADMPDILVVPDEWLWAADGLAAENGVVALQDLTYDNGEKIFDFTASKWNEGYTEMSTLNGNIYSGIADQKVNMVGMFVNKTLLSKVGMGRYGAGSLYELQQQDRWTFAELEKLIDKAIAADLSGQGIKLFADNDYLVRQLLVSAGVPSDPREFDANSKNYQEAVRLYQKLKSNNLLLEASGTEAEILDSHMESFSKNKLLFLVAPYTKVAKNFAPAYWYYEDNAIRRTDNKLAGWAGLQTYTGYDGDDWTVTVRQRPAGKYEMTAADWNFMLFPKYSQEDKKYRAIMYDASYPVLLSSTEKPSDVAMVFNQLSEEYKGVNLLNAVTKLGGEDYPDGRTWEPVYGDNAKDLDSFRKAALRDAFGDNYKASGVWDAVIKEAILAGSTDYAGINRQVDEFFPMVNENKPDKVETIVDQLLNELEEVTKDTPLTQKQKNMVDKAAQLVYGMTETEKEKVQEDTLKQLDTLYAAANALSMEIQVEIPSGGIKENLKISEDTLDINGIYLASNANSGDVVKLDVKQLIPSLDGNAKLELEFTLYVNGSKVQLKSPIWMKTALPAGITGTNMTIKHFTDEGSLVETLTKGSAAGKGRYLLDGRNVIWRTSSYSIFSFVEKQGSQSDDTDDDSSSSSSAKKEWVKSGNGWKYSYDGRYITNSWQKINNVWFRFDTGGLMQTGWIKDNNIWYFMKPDGSMAHDEWIQDQERWYYLSSSGSLSAGWLQVNNIWYYLKPDGTMAENEWVHIGDSWYYLTKGGAMKTGWLQEKDAWYYLKEDGSMLTDATTPDGYLIGPDGIWK